MMLLNKTSLNDYVQWLEIASTQGAAALIDKSKDWTSFDVVAKLRSFTRIKKVGHAGTLDPLATGLVIVCFGKATKSVNEFQDMTKKYSAVLKLGAVTASDDSELPEEDIRNIDYITEEAIRESASGFTGQLLQKPPKFSAKKINGRPQYKMARKNLDFEPAPCSVEVYKFDIKRIDLPFVAFDVECSKGTYIRSLARDMGQALGCGAYLSELRRTAIGDFSVDDAISIRDILLYKQNLQDSAPDY